MTAGRPGGLILASLLAVLLFSGCGWHGEYVRRGVVMDSVAVRLDRVERAQQTQEQDARAFRAELLAGLDALENRVDQLDARLVDLDERVSRIGRKLGVWHQIVIPGESVPGPDTLAPPPDSGAVGPDSLRPALDPDQLYNTAYLDFTRGNYRVAVAGLEQYLQMFPDSEMADNALYWIGECWYSLGELGKAEEEFKNVLIRYPTGNKVPAATYKLGLVYLAQNREDAARRQFEAVVEKYPGSTEAKLAQERLNR
ncbi:tol-pal system protein YbgF [candidate division WOR-3 bacterium]|nr:tol-pal system protein YbgF [candidate division WOR-3 bacterium]